MLTPAWYPLRYHETQSRLWRTKKRFAVVAAGRGSGKTECARRRIVRFLPVKKPWPDPVYFYALPTFNQAKRVAWKAIVRLIPKSWIKGEPNNSEMTIETVFGSTLYVIGMDKPQRAEGVQYDGGVVDESSDQRPGMFDLTLRPAMTHRNAWCWRIGVPKRTGIGAAEFKEAFNRGLEKDNPDTESFAWSSEDILTPEQLESAKMSMSKKDYDEQFRASWENASGAVFYEFDEVLNVQNVAYDPSKPLLVGSDFNVSPMSWVIGQEVGDSLHVFDEISIRDTNTPMTLTELHRRYSTHRAGTFFYGDATGRARKTSASASDYIIIKNDTRFVNSRVFYPQSNPERSSRFAACNALFCNALGKRRLLIHPRCVNLIKDLKQRCYAPGSNDPDDYGDIGHITDALGYLVYAKWPMRYAPKILVPQINV